MSTRTFARERTQLTVSGEMFTIMLLTIILHCVRLSASQLREFVIEMGELARQIFCQNQYLEWIQLRGQASVRKHRETEWRGGGGARMRVESRGKRRERRNRVPFLVLRILTPVPRSSRDGAFQKARVPAWHLGYLQHKRDTPCEDLS